jgi:hypothetical protein
MRSYRTRKTHKKQRGGFIDALKGLFGLGVSGETITDLPEPMEGETEVEETTNSLPSATANMVGGRRYKKSRKSKKAIKSRRHKSSRRRRHH